MSERYQINGELGRGGLGVVHRAYDTQLGRDVAIKRVLVDSDEPFEELTEDLITEARTLSTLKHPHIVTIHDVGRDEEGVFIVMELLEGETLDDIIEKAALPLADFKEFVVQSLEGMIAAHSAGLIHRDLKPANLMLVWLPSGKFQVKILDFGLAKFSQAPSSQTQSHDDSILGSIYFMTPEQFERAPLDARTDLYSLGCIFYYTLAGDYPFRGKSPVDVMTAHLFHRLTPLHDLRPDVPESICTWIDSLMARNMDDRPADARAALDAWCPEPIIDEKQVREVTSNNPEVATALLSDFKTETGGLLEKLKQELESGEGVAAEETARTIRGTASTLGYLEIVGLALKIEKNVRTHPELCPDPMGQLPSAMDRLENTVANIRWADQTGS
ncbi:protein kinase domain-containing protein [Haloferula sp.]|uniref:protein kinase domain-containing protein n=1 Tax=Haloferula sp. TaxID=2497595 RepID=UPI003C79639A